MRTLMIAVLLAFPARPQADPPQAGGKLPEPAPEEAKQTQKEIRDLFKNEYAQTSKAARQSLAARFLQFGRSGSERPVNRYAVLKEAIELALLAEDAEIALGAAEEVIKTFEVDGIALKADVLSRAKHSTAAPDAARMVAKGYADLLQEALDADAYDAAMKAVPKAQSAARAAKDPAILEKVEALSKEISELRGEYASAARHRETLKVNPADPDANAAWGTFLCLVKGDWEKGLPLLSRGADERLRRAAEKDLAAGSDPAAQMAAGDAWADMIPAERKALRKAQLIARASYWYRTALPRLDALSRLRATARLEEWERSAPRISPGRPGGLATDLLSWIDPAAHSADPRSRWTLRGRALVSGENVGNQQFCRLQIPCAPPAEYELTVAFRRLEGEGPFAVGLSAGGGRFVVLVRGGGAVSAGLFGGDDSHELARKYPADKVAGRAELQPEGKGKPDTLVCAVRARHLQVSLNGHVVIDWKNPPYAEASPPEEIDVPNRECIYLAARDVATYEVSQISLRAMGGGPPRRIAIQPPAAPRGER